MGRSQIVQRYQLIAAEITRQYKENDLEVNLMSGMTINSIAKNHMDPAMMKMATMQRVNSAADDAAGLAIMEKIETQIRGLEKGNDNTLDMKNLVKTAEGGLSTIDDSLQRIRELSVQASNGIYNDEDRALIQQEVSQMLQHIDSVAKDTQFNNMKLLDGSFTDKHTASYADGSGATVSIDDMSTSNLGIQGFDVTKEIDLGAIDKALSQVASQRSTLGAMENRFDHTVNANSITLLNQAAAKSRIADLDVAKGMMDVNRARILNETQIYTQKMQQQSAGNTLSLLT
jgi:flagellin